MNAALLQELKNCVGDKWVFTRPADLLTYSFDSALDRGVPSAVVLPGTTEQVSQVVRVLSKSRTPYVARGAATSLCGGPVPLHGAVVIALARLNKIIRIDKDKQEAIVEPGVVNLKLQQAVSPYGLFYAPDPGSQKACTLGGNVGTNAGGPHCLKYGVTSNFVMGLDVVLPDGQMTQLRVDEPGYDLTGFMVGSEGTLGIVTRVRLKLLPKPAYVRTMLVSFSSIEDAIQAVTDTVAAGVLPATMEAMDRTTVAAVEAFAHAGYPLNAEAVLLVEVDGDQPEDLDRQVEKIKQVCQKNNTLEFRFAQDENERAKLWEGRRGAYPAMARLAPNVLVEDGAVPRTKLPEALQKIKEIAERAQLRVALLFHAGDGNLHPQIIFDERNKEQTEKVKEAGYQMLKACVDLGGTISGEHGIGIDKREAMKWLFTKDTLFLFRRLKNAFDPHNVCNPDKLIPLVSKKETEAETKKGAPDFPQVNSLGLAVPATEEETIEAVRKWAATKSHFSVQGSRSKYRIQENVVLQTTKLNKILDFDRGNLTVTVQAGSLVQEVRSHVEQAGQYLWVAGSGTVGGVIATRASAAPPLRDQILGMRVLLPTGEVTDLGAKTMKNVAGYDVPKLLIGSWGTLGIILNVTFRLFPYPAKELKAEPVRPFVFRDLHRRVKKAFDPHEVLSMRLTMLTANDINAEAAQKPPSVEEDKLKKIADKFWL